MKLIKANILFLMLVFDFCIEWSSQMDKFLDKNLLRSESARLPRRRRNIERGDSMSIDSRHTVSDSSSDAESGTSYRSDGPMSMDFTMTVTSHSRSPRIDQLNSEDHMIISPCRANTPEANRPIERNFFPTTRTPLNSEDSMIISPYRTQPSPRGGAGRLPERSFLPPSHHARPEESGALYSHRGSTPPHQQNRPLERSHVRHEAPLPKRSSGRSRLSRSSGSLSSTSSSESDSVMLPLELGLGRSPGRNRSHRNSSRHESPRHGWGSESPRHGLGNESPRHGLEIESPLSSLESEEYSLSGGSAHLSDLRSSSPSLSGSEYLYPHSGSEND